MNEKIPVKNMNSSQLLIAFSSPCIIILCGLGIISVSASLNPLTIPESLVLPVEHMTILAFIILGIGLMVVFFGLIHMQLNLMWAELSSIKTAGVK